MSLGVHGWKGSPATFAPAPVAAALNGASVPEPAIYNRPIDFKWLLEPCEDPEQEHHDPRSDRESDEEVGRGQIGPLNLVVEPPESEHSSEHLHQQFE
jgi:hypothetical protein